LLPDAVICCSRKVSEKVAAISCFYRASFSAFNFAISATYYASEACRDFTLISAGLSGIFILTMPVYSFVASLEGGYSAFICLSVFVL